MPQIHDVTLYVSQGGSRLPQALRQVTVNYVISFSQYEIAGHASFTETISLYGFDNGRINESERLAQLPSNKVIVARQYDQPESLTAVVQRGQLDEDPDRYNWCECRIVPDCDEIAARVCLTPIQTTECCAESPCWAIAHGSWGQGGAS